MTRAGQSQAGISYVEVMVATILVVLMLVPALDALQPGIQGSALHRERAQNHYALFGKMESLLAEHFADLDAAASAAGSPTTATSYSDVTPQGIPRQVYIWRYDADDADGDADPFTGGDADLLWISVALADASQSLQTLVSRY